MKINGNITIIRIILFLACQSKKNAYKTSDIW